MRSPTVSASRVVMQGLTTDPAEGDIAVALVDPGWMWADMGGAGADEDPAEVAAGIIALAATLTLDQTAGFFTWRGEPRAFCATCHAGDTCFADMGRKG